MSPVGEPDRTVYASVSCLIGNREFVWGERTYVMGIVNVTPDSFSGDGIADDEVGLSEVALQRVVAQARSFVEEGADFIDVGGESTRPGSKPVTADIEASRVLPAIKAIRALTEIPISVDTYRASVAARALDLGADMVNDVWGLQMDPSLGELVAERSVPIILMHNRSRPKDAAQEQRLGGRYVGVKYDDLLGDILSELGAQVSQAEGVGIARERIIVDPGIGFGKTVEQNLSLLNRAGELRSLGLPILLGPSRKSFIGYTLELPPDERVEGTTAAIAVGIVRNGVDIIRAHDVRSAVRAARMTDAIVRARD